MKSKPNANSQQYSKINNPSQLNPNTIQQINQASSQHQVREQTYRYKHSVRQTAIKFIGVAVLFFFAFQFISQALKMHYTSSSLDKVNAQLTETQEQNKNLKNEQKKLNNPDYLEQILRDKYQYTKDGEIIYNLPKDAE